MAYLEMRNITKQFGEVLANNCVNLSVEKEEIHALLGENGAGKTTLMNVLYGMYDFHEGEIFIDGKQVKIRNPRDAITNGVGMVHQHFMLIPAHNVVENVVLGLPDNHHVLNLKSAANRIKDITASMGIDIDPWAKVEDLTVGQQQRVEIIKALYRNVNILILDEPTAVLTPQETRNLFRMIKKLVANGMTVIFISHKLAEIMEICDRCTILRQGKVVKTVKVAEVSDRNELATLMIDREFSTTLNKSPASFGDVVMEVKNLNYITPEKIHALHNISFQLHRGEILGVCGVDGNGQSELVRCLTGLLGVNSGSIQIMGEECVRRSTREIINMGISHIPEDRQSMAVVPGLSVSENLILMNYKDKEHSNHGILRWSNIHAVNTSLCERYNIKTPNVHELLQNLSGGNQQKVVVARELDRSPAIIIAMHPSRGLDVGATRYIQEQILQARENGTAVLLVSTELEEILELSDNIIVMYKGTVMEIVDRKNATPEYLGLLMAGIHPSS